MKRKKIFIRGDQYLSDVINKLESNSIYEKPTGSGITTIELNSDRNSILIEPNKPVIQGKCEYYNLGNRRKLIIRGVYEGITVDDIVKYLSSNIKYKKIITTPESYPKVVEAFKQIDMLDEMYSSYFMLFDECEKTIQDMDYRKNIILPVNDFFKFKSKAFVSATPIIPSDPRFATQKFKYVEVVPSYQMKQDVNLRFTNNVLLEFNNYLKENLKPQYFIFANSTNLITQAIDFLSIHDNSLVFCSDESKEKINLNNKERDNKFLAHSTLLKTDKFLKYNFFTSRFNSAVDIHGIRNPNIIIILSSIFVAEHTKVDPNSEVIQIVGRFRKSKEFEIVRNLTHITNFNPDLHSDSKKDLLSDIETFKHVFDTINKFAIASTTFTAKEVIREMLSKSEFSKYINSDGSVNHYMIDNVVFQNNVNGYYQSEENLLDVYKKSKRYKIKVSKSEFTLKDRDLFKDEKSVGLKSSLELLMPVFKKLYKQGLDSFETQLELTLMEKTYRSAYETFMAVGFNRACELGFDYHKVKAEFKGIQSRLLNKHFGMIGYLDESIQVGKHYTLTEFQKILSDGFKEQQINNQKANIPFLKQYFDISQRQYITGRGCYGYTVRKKLF